MPVIDIDRLVDLIDDADLNAPRGKRKSLIKHRLYRELTDAGVIVVEGGRRD